MKFILLFFLAMIPLSGVAFIFIPKKLKTKKKIWGLIFVGSAIISAILLGIAFWLSIVNKQCGMYHNTSTNPPTVLKTSLNYFEKGNYDYDIGNCKLAIDDYTKAIKLNSRYAEAYNNRAFTYMMLSDYKSALTDLNTAIKIRPTYDNALMNRGDIYNYYLPDKTKALADYDAIIALGPQVINKHAVCSHRLMAVDNHNQLKVFIDLLLKRNVKGCN